MKYWVLFCSSCGASFSIAKRPDNAQEIKMDLPESCCIECNVVFRRGDQHRDSLVVGEYEDDVTIDLDPGFVSKPKPVDKHIDRFDSILGPKKEKKIIVPDKIVVVDDFIPINRPGICTGMNWWAAQTLCVNYQYDKDTVVVVNPKSPKAKVYIALKAGVPRWSIEVVVRHEQVESEFMQKGDDYDTAHKKTLALVGGERWDDIDRRKEPKKINVSIKGV